MGEWGKLVSISNFLILPQNFSNQEFISKKMKIRMIEDYESECGEIAFYTDGIVSVCTCPYKQNDEKNHFSNFFVIKTIYHDPIL